MAFTRRRFARSPAPPSRSPRGLRILAFHHHPDLYGSDLMLLQSAAGLRGAGADVRVMVPDEGPLLERLAAAHVPYEIVGYPQLKKSMLNARGILRLATRLPLDLARLMTAIRRSRPDAVYVNTLTLPHAILASRLLRKPVVCHVHELESQLPALTSRVLTGQLLAAHLVIANSRATADYVGRNWPSVSGRTRVVYNGLELPDLGGSDNAQGNGEVCIALVGRLSPRKGQDVAVRALHLLQVRHGVTAQLHLIGTVFSGYEWYERQLVELVAELGLSERVHFDGYIEQPWLMRPGIAVVPSRVEPFGNVAVEAMAAEAATVVSDVGGLPEIVDHGKTGLVVPADDPEALAGAVARLMGDARFRRQLGSDARRDVIDRFSASRYVEEIGSALVELTDR